jgi:carboxypeptidase Q
MADSVTLMHSMRMRFLILTAAAAVLPAVVAGQEKVDLPVVNKIRHEAFENSKVMEHLSTLSDVYGGRLAGSSSYRKAAEWTVKALKEWGLADAGLEKWGTFGRGWSYSRFSLHMLEPVETPLLAVPLVRSAGTSGPVSGEVVMAEIRTVEDTAKFQGKLGGKFVMMEAPRQINPHLEPDAHRYSDADLAAIALAPDPAQSPARRQRPDPKVRNAINQFLKGEGVLGVLNPGYGGDDGTLFTAPAASRDMKDAVPPLTMTLATEQYNRLARLLERKVTVKLEADAKIEFQDNVEGFNVIADLPGGRKKDEVVIIGAHLDSWHAGTGAADDAAGVAVMMEALRILTSLNLKMDRTVRIGLWDAEEEGLIGSREYVKAHLGDPESMALKPEHAKVAGYFNFDNGAGKIRGVYLQGNDMMRPVFGAWLEPFKDLGATTISIRNTGGTDHLSFDAVGLPGFQFIQDPLDYDSRVHHTNMDVYDRVPQGDLMQASAVVASFVYNAAMRPDPLPRKPAPKPRPASQP